MRTHSPHRALPPLFALLLAACGGGGGGGAPASQCTANEPGLCLVSCNLGCTSSGCGVLEIAQNQVLAFTFDRPVDPTSVAAGGIDLRDTLGERPGGSFHVEGANVTFVPEAKVVGGTTLYGFRAGDTYRLALRPQGSATPLRAVSSEALTQGLNCSLTVSRGIVDVDGKAPSAELDTPSQRSGVPRDTEIVVRFSELVDSGPFATTTETAAPVRFRVRKPRRENGLLVCDPAATPVVLEGSSRLIQDAVRQISLVGFRPALPLPIGTCVEVEITERLKDLAGTPARPTLLGFVTREEAPAQLEVLEAFGDAGRLDAAASSGVWGGGLATPGRIGGDGLHGDFDPADGALVAPSHYVWSTDQQPIRGVVQVAGQPPLSPVTDGVFRFASFVIPKGTTVEFRGTRPARIHVQGDLRVDGRLLLHGRDLVAHDGNTALGQVTSEPGAGGGRGGSGGDRCDGSGNGVTAFSGRPGRDVVLPLGHSYATRALGTGGAGGALYPASGRNADVSYGWSFGQFCAMVPAGGAGGGQASAGGAGRATASPTSELGPPSAAGAPFDPFPLPSGIASLDHFLIGGAGGGGAPSHALLATKGFPSGPRWYSGSAGASAGGALALRVGRDLSMGLGALLSVRGGSAATYALSAIDQGPPAPGGGGSGGSVLLQCGGNVALLGEIDLRGGGGGRWELGPILPMESLGGDGGAGRVRLEQVPRPPLSALGTTLPPAGSADVEVLQDRDLVVGQRSLWYTSRQAFAPSWLRYVVEAEVGGVPRIFSDDATLGAFAGPGAGQALVFLVQGGTLAPAAGTLVQGSERPWRDRVGTGATPALAGDGCNGLRFVLLFDRRIASQIVVKRVVLAFREPT